MVVPTAKKLPEVCVCSKIMTFPELSCAIGSLQFTMAPKDCRSVSAVWLPGQNRTEGALVSAAEIKERRHREPRRTGSRFKKKKKKTISTVEDVHY